MRSLATDVARPARRLWPLTDEFAATETTSEAVQQQRAIAWLEQSPLLTPALVDDLRAMPGDRPAPGLCPCWARAVGSDESLPKLDSRALPMSATRTPRSHAPRAIIDRRRSSVPVLRLARDLGQCSATASALVGSTCRPAFEGQVVKWR